MQRYRLALTALTVAGMGLLGPPRASAHAFLDHAEPRVGSSVSTAPAAVTLTFTETVEPGFCHVEVRSAHGNKVAAGELEHPKPEDVRLPLPPLLSGNYTVHWTVNSVDAHQTQGRFEFTVSPPSPGSQNSRGRAHALPGREDQGSK